MDQEKKACILRAATKAFSQFGFKKASVDDIARNAGVAKGTVYLACESKEDLFYQTLHGELRAWNGETAKLIDPRTPADKLLGMCAAAAIANLDSHPLLRDLFEGNYRNLLPGWRDRFEELRELGRANVIEILKLGIRQGRFRKNLAVEDVASLLLDLQLTTYLFHSASGEGRDARLARRLHAGMDLVLHGLRTHSARD